MSCTAQTRAPAALVAVLAAVVLTAGPARALPVPSIPPDVSEAFAGPALRQAQAADDGVAADFSGVVRAEHVHEVFRFTPPFTDGGPVTEPVVSAGQWIAALMRGDRALGTLGVWKPDGGPAQPFGFSNDVAIGEALATVSATEILIVDEPNGAYYALSGTTVRPLNDWARESLPRPADLAVLRKAVMERYALLRSQPRDYVDPPAIPISLTAMGLALAVATGLLLIERRRRRRPQRS